jgi:hypothetical protein
MVGSLLMRGMLVGIVAGILSFGFLKIVGEPEVDHAIAFEAQMDATKIVPIASAQADDGIVSRSTQAGIGLFVAVVVYNAAFGGLFALAFALAYGRVGELGPRSTAALLALLGLVSVTLVPGLKYPADPPSVGLPETIGIRTSLYFSLIFTSLAAAVAGGMLRSRLLPRWGAWNAALIGVAAYGIALIAVMGLLPSVDEVPNLFPATVLWQFRMASFGAQSIMWLTLGLLFGILTERAAHRSRRADQAKHAWT